MSKIEMNDSEISKVNGGTIWFNDDCTQCGYFCDNQYRVVNLDYVVTYINEHSKDSERKTLADLCAAGYLVKL